MEAMTKPLQHVGVQVSHAAAVFFAQVADQSGGDPMECPLCGRAEAGAKY
jgi:hypothetical protein